MKTPKEGYLDFEAYERAKEPHVRQRAQDWGAAIGLQDVDGLKVSVYLNKSKDLQLQLNGDINPRTLSYIKECQGK